MSARSTLVSTALIGLLAGAGILQLLDSGNPALEPVAVDVAEPRADASSPIQSAEQEPAATTATTGVDASDSIGFVSRGELEEALPRSIVNVLIDHNALLIEKVEANAP